jgi:hypothetical protein
VVKRQVDRVDRQPPDSVPDKVMERITWSWRKGKAIDRSLTHTWEGKQTKKHHNSQEIMFLT